MIKRSAAAAAVVEQTLHWEVGPGMVPWVGAEVGWVALALYVQAEILASANASGPLLDRGVIPTRAGEHTVGRFTSR